MKISDVKSATSAAIARRKKKSEGKGAEFAEHLKEAAEKTEAGAALETSSVQAVDSILAVQEVPDATEERSRDHARRHGENLLERLDQLRHDLLVGAVPKDKLADLARAVRSRRRRSNDPRLNEIIDEIELRAEVEIAKLTRDV